MSWLSLTLVLWLGMVSARADGFWLPPIFTDNMVLQQSDGDLDDPCIWGRADKSEKISVEFRGKTSKAKMESDGTWKLKLELKVSKPDTNPPSDLIILNRRKEVLVRLTNVVVGEVWVLGLPAPALVDFDPTRWEHFARIIQAGWGQRCRLLTLPPGINAAAESAGPMEWRITQPDDGRPESRLISNHTAYLAQGILEAGVGFVGIIEAPREDVIARVPVGTSLPRLGSAIEHGFVASGLVWPAVRDATDARDRYFTSVANLKRIGLVTNAPPPPLLSSPQRYSPGRLPGLDFALRGSIW